MAFTSMYFIIFIILTILLYYIVKKDFQWIVLLFASYFFYTVSDLRGLFFILFTTIISFFSARFLSEENKKLEIQLKKLDSTDKIKKADLKLKSKKSKKKIVSIATIVLLGVLVFLKYFNFFLMNMNGLFNFFNINTQFGYLNLLLPLGISFYTFQSVGYVIDVYRNKYDAEKNIFKFALFISFFPQIVQGPIARFDRLSTQLYESKTFDFENIRAGIYIMLWGFFKKMVIADRLYLVVNEIFNNYINYGGFVIFTGVVFYAIQIYCDFSGGIDVAIGVSKCLGITLDENFKRPFFADSVADYWRRWHITLGSWVKDYFFYPLALSKSFGTFSKFSRKKFGNVFGKIIPSSIVTFISFILVGLWHGSSWKYVAFGLFNGTIISLSMFLDVFLKNKTKIFGINLHSKGWKVFKIFRTFLIVCIGRYFTRSATFMTALKMLKATFSNPDFAQFKSGVILNMGLNTYDFIIIIVALCIVFIVSFIEEQGVVMTEFIGAKNGFIQMFSLFVLLFFVIFFGIYRDGYAAVEFIYMQF